MEASAHYLKLAYLAETAIVFNLAYIELSWKKQFDVLTNKMNSLSASTLTTFNRNTVDSICNKTQCNKCEDTQHTGDKFNIFEVGHLSELVSIISSGSSHNDRTVLSKAWKYSECNAVFIYVLVWFHFFVNKYLDRKASFLSLILASTVLVVMSMVDNNVDFMFNLLRNVGAWNSVGTWSFWLLNILSFTMVLPGILWIFWKIFLRKYECLSFSLINAYQKKTRGDFSASINNLPS